MKKTTRVRMLVAATATATVVLTGASIGAAFALGTDETRPEQQPHAVRHGIVESESPNPWLANDCAILRRTVPEDFLIGC